MPTLWFVIPAHGRIDLARACLRTLAGTCSTLTEHGLRASAVIIADDENLDTARELGFATVQRENTFLGAKWNDGYQAAALEGVDYVVPFGSDDLIDPATILARLPEPTEIRSMRRTAVVNETGTRLATLHIAYPGGDGVRIIPTSLLEPVRYRPCDEDRNRALDASLHRRLEQTHSRKIRFVYHDEHALQAVDFKSPRGQLNTYTACLRHAEGPELDPWEQLAEHYPADALHEIAAVYGQRLRAAA